MYQLPFEKAEPLSNCLCQILNAFAANINIAELFMECSTQLKESAVCYIAWIFNLKGICPVGTGKDHGICLDLSVPELNGCSAFMNTDRRILYRTAYF